MKSFILFLVTGIVLVPVFQSLFKPGQIYTAKRYKNQNCKAGTITFMVGNQFLLKKDRKEAIIGTWDYIQEGLTQTLQLTYPEVGVQKWTIFRDDDYDILIYKLSYQEPHPQLNGSVLNNSVKVLQLTYDPKVALSFDLNKETDNIDESPSNTIDFLSQVNYIRPNQNGSNLEDNNDVVDTELRMGWAAWGG